MSPHKRDKGFYFVIGGARSGKSSFALKLAESFAGPHLYLATAEPFDAEMEERIRRHREERGQGWDTLEEPKDIASKISGEPGYGVVLIDCLTLWLANLIASGTDDGGIEKGIDGLVGACKLSSSKIIAVSNEVGLGIVPDNPLSRRFRDLSGIMNRRMAEAAMEVYFVASGIPLKMK